MRLVTPAFLEAFPRAVINVHPALLPAFPGMHAVQQALDYGVKVSGCTVHFVDEGTDTGPIIAQATVPVHATDDAASLSARIQTEEHLLFPQVVWDVAHGRVSLHGRKVTFSEGAK
jgi:phosphoribosylglycinamide formyltransferase-1